MTVILENPYYNYSNGEIKDAVDLGQTGAWMHFMAFGRNFDLFLHVCN